MNKQDLIDFYKNKQGWLPDDIQKGKEHFNVFRLDSYVGEYAEPVPYTRRDFYKITFFRGNAQIHYADRYFEVKKQALVFSNPQIPYKWEGLEGVESGYFCIFDQDFFNHFGEINKYPVFRVGGMHLFELSDEQRGKVVALFQKMQEELVSNYLYKHDSLRTQVMDLIHFAMKMQPSLENEIPQNNNASHRIVALFSELLERQFSIENGETTILRVPSDYAKQLNIHTNHLNRAVKEIMGRTTSEIINERLIQEAKILLRYTES